MSLCLIITLLVYSRSRYEVYFISLLTAVLALLLPIIVAAPFRKKIYKLQVRKDASQITGENFRRTRKKVLIGYLVLFVAAGLSRTVSIFQTNSREFIPRHGIAWAVPRPGAHSVKKYTDYLKTNRQDINDYIFGLFEKYDHVILCERAHPECTQYDMISDLISDNRFVENIGVVFTEIGNVESREDYKQFVSTSFPNDSTVEKELAAFLMKKNQTTYFLWPRTNWFYFLKKVYYLNQERKKIDIAFSDCPYLDPSSGWKLEGRDSLMAANIISTIRADSLKKSLTIMNFRHAYLINDNNDNCSHYVASAFPGRVANVLINTVSFKYASESLFAPIQHGKWDAAFEQMPDSAFAFDLKGSPFGKDRFDHFVFFSPLSKKRYEDMFTGVIYYLPLYKHILSDGYPYMLDGENEEILLQHAASISQNKYDEAKKYLIPYYKKLGKGTIMDTKQVYFKINLIENKIFITLYVIGLLVAVYLGIAWFIFKSKT